MTLTLPARSLSSVRVYDVAGRLVRTLVEGNLDAGPHEIVWDGTDDAGRRVASGVYFAASEPEVGRSVAAKVVLLR